ncbi:flagellar hook-associated protein FlgL [Xanthomonas sp. XNM01]|uniref:flagellar hook-associated protein FlgL n=1 Tax=Xanthomonas sp. XNM01 TaxID=2769289 RepID=UPI00178041F7|nr:flagellar hook-associated protein FlgL [Xanthomonas sp. XNM01]MBD9368313.1 flagellar hook-associated protein FlgL [Xanthomonas sp. XNM01]
MSTRISTGMVFNQTIGTLFNKQANLAKLQEQLATGKKLVTAKDDPVGAGAAVSVDRALAELERYGSNANTMYNRLGLQENSLSQAGEIMRRINDLTIQANSGAMSDSNRLSISREVSSLRDSLLDLANGTDGTGRYLFGGTADSASPFALGGSGVIYSGDQTQRRVEVGPETSVTDTLPGSEVFLRIRTGDGRLDASSGVANAGTGIIGQYSLQNADVWNGQRFTLSFTAEDTWALLDAGGAPVLNGAGDPVTGTFEPGQSVSFNGVSMQIIGQPAAGDTFEIGPSATRDVFATIDRLIEALASEPTTEAEKTHQQNLLQSSMRDITAAQEHMIDVRAIGGAQLAALDSAGSMRDAHSVTLKSTLSELRDLDYAEAISRFTLEKTALEAAQLTFTQTQRLSLFDFLR